jgi:D-alanyl-D-alanine carboxypeptidase
MIIQMKDLTVEETLTYNALLHNIRTYSGNNAAYHIARLKEFVDIMLEIKKNTKRAVL